MEPFWVISGTATHILVSHSIRVTLSTLQRTLGHTVEQCIASKAQSLCHACTRDRESRVGSRGVVGKRGSATFSACLHCVYIRRGLSVRQWKTHPHPARSVRCNVLWGQEGLKFSGALHFRQPKISKSTKLHYKYIIIIVWSFTNTVFLLF